jgi:hypothetical protein
LRDLPNGGVPQDVNGFAMTRRQKKKEQKMKTGKQLIVLGAAAVAVITLNLNASAALLSPRAAGNQIVHTPGVANDPNLVAENVYASSDGSVLSPRAASAQSTKASDVSNVNPTLACAQKMTASPKLIQACAANPANMPCCNSSAG